MALPNRKLVAEVRKGLADSAHPKRALGAQAYMKSEMPFRGVSAPEQRKIYKLIFADHPIEDQDKWMATALELWRKARFREERYAAIELTGHRPYREFQTMATMPMYEEMIVTGAWWDYVDTVAIHRVGEFLIPLFPAKLKPLMRKWSRSDDMWKRRTSIICQVSLKQETDLDLLYHCIATNFDHKDFFIRKAIGWALRSYAWIDPDEVVRYVEANEGQLSSLSKKEALKNVGK